MKVYRQGKFESLEINGCDKCQHHCVCNCNLKVIWGLLGTVLMQWAEMYEKFCDKQRP